MNCKICGYEIPDESITCSKCGAPVIDDDATDILEEAGELDGLETNDENDIADTENYAESIEGDISETEEDSDDESSEESYDESELEETRRVPGAFKIVAAVIAVVLIAAAAAAAYFHFFVPGVDNPVLSIFGIKTAQVEKQPMIYTKQVDGKYNIYVKGENAKETLLKSADTAESTFSLYSDFIIGGKNLFFIDNKSLFSYTIGEAAPVKITDNALVGSMVISAKHDTILFIQKADDAAPMDLYKYKKGSKGIEKIETLSQIKQSDQNPVYGFLDNTNDVWYIKLNAAESAQPSTTNNGELFVKLAGKQSKSLANDVSSLIFGSNGGETLLYSSQQGENAALNLKEKGKDVVVLTDKFNNNKPIIVNSPAKGVFYLGDINEASADSQTGAPAAGTLYYQKFGGEKVEIDKGVGAMIKLSLMNAQTSAVYDYGVENMNTDDSIAYMKDNNVFISKNGKPGTIPEGLSFFEANPTFAKDGNSVAFLSEKALKYSKYENGAWTAPENIADNVARFTINKDGSSIAYFVADEADQMKAMLSIYSTKTKQSQTLTDKAIGGCYFDGSGKTLLYTSDYNQEKNAAVLNASTEGKPNLVVDNEVNGFIVSESFVPYAVKTTGAGSNAMDIYTINSDMKMELISQGIQNINHY